MTETFEFSSVIALADGAAVNFTFVSRTDRTPAKETGCDCVSVTAVVVSVWDNSRKKLHTALAFPGSESVHS